MQKRHAIALLCLSLGIASCRRPPAPHSLSIAAAADLNFALEELTREYRAEHPALMLRVAYGSSGNFYTQLQNHAPFDIFLSADVDYPRKLANEGLAAEDSLFIYGIGRIAVWVPANSALDPQTALRSPSLHHLAIANPQHAPYGRAAQAALRKMGIYDSVEAKLVLGENISQTLQFAQSGAADAGIVALSLVSAPSVKDQGRYWEIPIEDYPRIEQGGVIVKESPDAREFRSWLMSPGGRTILKRYGFSLPGA